MFRRIAIVAVTAAVALPMLGGTASASCLDDFQARRLDEGYTQSPKSEGYWPFYVQQSGTATVTIYGDALISDYSSFLVQDVPLYATVVATNAADATTDFVDCVAG